MKDSTEDDGVAALVKAHADHFVAPEALRERIQAATAAAGRPGRARVAADRFAPLRQRWFAPGLAFAAGVCVTCVGVTLLRPDPSDAALSLGFIGEHARAVVSHEPLQVASSNNHTVKPWLSAALGYSPKVIDLGDQGFALLGGRVGFVGAERVAVMTYRYKDHTIDVYALPGAAAASGRLPELSQDGYRLVTWRDGDMRYVAVSDVDAARLAELRELLQRDAGGAPD